LAGHAPELPESFLLKAKVPGKRVSVRHLVEIVETGLSITFSPPLMIHKCLFSLSTILTLPKDYIKSVNALGKNDEGFCVLRAYGPHDHIDQLRDELVNGRAVFDEPFKIDAKNIDDELLNQGR